MAFLKSTKFERFFIGSAYNPYSKQTEKFWTNIAVDHKTGRLSNEELLFMTDERLKTFVFKGEDTYYTEKYIRPDDKAEAERQGGKAGEEYEAVLRAYIILQYRQMEKENKQFQEAIERDNEFNESLNNLAAKMSTG